LSAECSTFHAALNPAQCGAKLATECAAYFLPFEAAERKPLHATFDPAIQQTEHATNDCTLYAAFHHPYCASYRAAIVSAV
jgi:hypothetical protein